MDPTLIQRMEALLRTDPLANVMALKFLNLLGRISEGGMIEETGRWAVWFHYPPDRFAFDAKTYPNWPQIVYWNANDRGAALTSASSLPEGALVKVSSEPCLSLAREFWPRVNSFLWLSAERPVPAGLAAVEAFSKVHRDLMGLSSENGYGPAALAEQESRGCRWFLARVDGEPQGLCFVQPNHGAIWEISGVWVRPGFRGRGLAKAVVAAAVNDLVSRGLTPRYFVHDENRASLGVARGLGLTERGRTQHFGPVSSLPERVTLER